MTKAALPTKSLPKEIVIDQDKPVIENNSVKYPLILGLLIIIAVFIIAPFAAEKTMIQSAVVAQGKLNKIGNKSFIQHETGGVLSQVQVKNGDMVALNDILFIIDSTIETADLNDLNVQLRVQKEAAQRFKSFLDYTSQSFDFNKTPSENINLRLVEESLKSIKNQELTNLKEIATIEKSQISLQQAKTSLNKQLELLQSRFDVQSSLLDRQLTDKSRIDNIELDIVANEIEQERLSRQIIDNAGRIENLKKEISQREIDFKKSILEELINAEQGIERLEQAIAKTQHSIDRKIVYAPIAGTITNMAELTPQSVISPQQILAEILPVSQEITANILVPDIEIDGIELGDVARIQLQTNTDIKDDKFEGEVTLVSADRLNEEDLSQFYEVIVTLNNEDFKEQTLPNGIPVIGYLSTEPKSLLTYVLEPVFDVTKDIFSEK